mmetsp:Transcript_10250/g.47056  ORF Transcript_10250/g.47056 Transcript_10250/m.47056 type:complete len:212 (-) Transcript_10250:4999-5634(-)
MCAWTSGCASMMVCDRVWFSFTTNPSMMPMPNPTLRVSPLPSHMTLAWIRISGASQSIITASFSVSRSLSSPSYRTGWERYVRSGVRFRRPTAPRTISACTAWSMRALVRSGWPPALAYSPAQCPSLSNSFHGAPAARRLRTTSTCPYSHASINGVVPLRSWKPGSAPSRMSASTASTSPVEAARRSRRDAMSAVHSTRVEWARKCGLSPT